MNRFSSGAWATALLLAVAGLAEPLPAAAASGSVAAGSVDTAAVAKILSDYRATHGLPPVKVETKLMQIAAVHAQRMAAADDLDHVLPGEVSFIRRMNAGGYDPAVAAEDIGAGYKTLAEVIAAWEKSPEHNANILQPNVSEIGIALYTTPAGIYNEYWSLVLAKPEPPRTAGASDGPFGGGLTVGPFGFFGN